MSSAHRRANSDSDSDSESDTPTKQPSKPRRSRDDLSGNQTFETRTRTSAARKPSEKQDKTNKENLTSAAAQLAAVQKKVASLMKKVGQMKDPLEDEEPRDMDGPESEEEMSDQDRTSFPSITPLGRLPAPPARPTTVFRKTNKAQSTAVPKLSRKTFKRLPELTAEELGEGDSPRVSPARSAHDDDGVMDEDGADNAPPPPPPRLDLSQERGRAAAGAAAGAPSRKRAQPSQQSPAPPPKRTKSKAKEAKFREGFVAVPGVRPKAADYDPVVEAILLRSMAEYSARILAINGFPGITIQVNWADECFNNACRSAKERLILTDRMSRLITKRGSHIRGKTVDGFRPLFATHYGFQRSTKAAIVKSNKAKSDALIHKASFHYKDPVARTGYGENSIIAEARHHSVFKNKYSLGVIFGSYFNPIPGPYLAMDFSVLEFLATEWSTGIHIPSQFTEKEMSKAYQIHLADVATWCSTHPVVTENIRRRLYKKACIGLRVTATSEERTHIDDAQKDALRAELAGRTGDTDSEPEPEEPERDAERGTGDDDA
ncbi:hypothetical protein B0H17DRAFT_1215370 [Mycena rosella]|uniref:DUF6532 domain-containing protein n=1 Tax=Mycena rosella TaxID=1033263 RepID=A0AAD7G0B6_MYCRO|nr:hypothetical protein B0H17DRAFT_1215370 [Mycena rosella]